MSTPLRLLGQSAPPAAATRWVCALVVALTAWLAPGQAAAQNLCVGNMVFVDTNGNGVYDNNEGVGNVLVQAWRGTGNNEYVLQDTRITQSNGFYLFQGLLEGSYYLTIPASQFGVAGPLHGMLSVPGAQLVGDDDTGEDGQDAFDPATTGVSTMEFMVEPGFGPVGAAESGFFGSVDNADDANSDVTIDFGFYRPVGVGNLVFADNNGNGRADPGEGIPGVVIQLFRDTDDVTTDFPLTDLITDADGFYMFGGLAPGSYKLHLPKFQFQPGGVLEGSTSVPGVGLANSDDDAVGAGDNGVDDPNPAMNGITSGVLALQPGTQPTEVTGETGALAFNDDASDEDYNLTVDFGFVFPADRVGVGNLVFVDLDGNGHYDDGEGIGGVTVELFAQGQNPQTDMPVASLATRPDGSFLFGNVEAGNYFLHVPMSQFLAGGPLFSALSVTGSFAGDDDQGEKGLDVPYPESTGVSTAVFTLGVDTSPTDVTGETGYAFDSDNFRDVRVDLTRDLGFVLRAASPLAVGNLVFNDANANGHVDPGETGISGVTVRLFHEGDNPASATPVALQQTDTDGTYLFDGLTPGRYFVHIAASQFGVSAPLEGFMSSPGNGGDNDVDDNVDENGIDSLDPMTTGISSIVFELKDNNEPQELGFATAMDDADDDNGNLTIDFGFATNCAVLSITPATLSSGSKDQFYTQTFLLSGTAETPMWMISSGATPAGVTLSSGGVLSGTPTEAGTFGFDVMAEISGGCVATQTFSLVIAAPANLGVGNTVFFDTNHNGHYDAGEGVTNVTLKLVPEGEDPVSGPGPLTMSGINGDYHFNAVPPGRYFIHVPAVEFQSGGALFNTVSMTGAGKDVGVDDDVDENGVDGPAPAVNGVNSIVFELSAGDEPTDFTGETGRDGAGDLDDSNVDATIDLGFMAAPTVSVGLGNLVFLDGNNNQVFDFGEGVDGVLVQLFNGVDNPQSAQPIRQVTTNNGGRYSFLGLDPGGYKVFIPASQFVSGSPLYGCLSITGAGTAGAADDDVDENGVDSATPSTTGIVSTLVTLAVGTQPDNTIETGENGTGDDAGDTNADFTVDLGFARNCTTIAIAPGALSDGLVNTNYEAQFTASGGTAPYAFTLAYGTFPAGLLLDSSGHLSGIAGEMGTFTFGLQVTDDFGCLSIQPYMLTIASPPLGVGNLVFFDRNGNGHADPGEGVDGVTVELYQGSATPGVDSPTAQTTTANGGRYLIDNLQPHTYVLHVPKQMFQTGEPLWSMKSVPGVSTGDDEGGEDGQDAFDPAQTGVTSVAFNLAPVTAPAGTDESGIGGNSDDARDGDIDLTRDLGFVDATSLPPTYTEWQTSHGLTGPASGPTGNVDGDADSNLLEYAFGGNPSSGGQLGQNGYVITENQATGQMSLMVRQRHGGQADLTYSVQVIADLAQSPGGWGPISLVPTVVNNGDGTETLTYGPLESDPAIAGGSIGFVRVKVSLDADHNNTPEATDTTPVLGWQHRTIPLKNQTYSTPFAPQAVFTGTVDGVSGSTVTAAASAGSASLAGLMVSGREYYVEVMNGVLEGQRWEVDEGNSTSTTLVLLPANARSTLGSVPVSLTGALIGLRAHWRLIDLFPTSDLHATLNPNTADAVQFYDRVSRTYTNYWLANPQSGVQWTRIPDPLGLNRNTTVTIAPCEGVFVRPRTSNVTLGAAGQVRTWKTACPLGIGTSLVGAPYPMATSAVDRVMTVANGFGGSNNPNAADKFQLWDADGTPSATTSVTTYVLFKNTSLERWYKPVDPQGLDRSAEKLFLPNHATFIDSQAGLPTWVIPVPWAP